MIIVVDEKENYATTIVEKLYEALDEEGYMPQFITRDTSTTKNVVDLVTDTYNRAQQHPEADIVYACAHNNDNVSISRRKHDHIITQSTPTNNNPLRLREAYKHCIDAIVNEDAL